MRGTPRKPLRRDLAQIDHDGIDQFREAHHAAGQKLHDGGEAPLRHMAERQIAEHRVVLRIQPKDGDDLHRGVHHAAVAEHRAFRHAGGAGRIDDDGCVVGLAGGECGVDRRAEFGLFALAERHHGGKGHQAVLLVVAHAFHIDADRRWSGRAGRLRCAAHRAPCRSAPDRRRRRSWRASGAGCIAAPAKDWSDKCPDTRRRSSAPRDRRRAIPACRRSRLQADRRRGSRAHGARWRNAALSRSTRASSCAATRRNPSRAAPGVRPAFRRDISVPAAWS